MKRKALSTESYVMHPYETGLSMCVGFGREYKMFVRITIALTSFTKPVHLRPSVMLILYTLLFARFVVQLENVVFFIVVVGQSCRSFWGDWETNSNGNTFQTAISIYATKNFVFMHKCGFIRQNMLRTSYAGGVIRGANERKIWSSLVTGQQN